ncbi:hypothetical protein Tco_1391774, partial [Tanacetum coccineum]
KVKYCKDKDDNFTNFKTEFLVIVFDDITSNATLSCESEVSPLNDNEIDFRITFDKSDDKDYMVIFDENSFSYKIIFVDILKTDSEKDDKVDMLSFSSPEPTISHSDNLDFFKDFENEFPAITYNDDLTSKLTEPSISFQHIEEFNLNDETSLFEYDEEEQNILYFNDLFSLKVVFPNDLKSVKDIDDDEINVTQSSGSNAINIDTKGSNKLLKTSHGKIRKIFNVKGGFKPERLAQGLEVGSIRRIQGIGYGVFGFLGVGTTFDIFQNIHILYLKYGVLTSSRYGILSFIPLWSLVSVGTDMPYLP